MPAPIDAQVVVDPVRSPVCAPFLAFPDAVPPAVRHLRTFYTTRDLPAARTSLAASELPAGRAYYDLLLAINTTTSLDARTIHDLGRAEVARIGKATDAILRETGYHARRAQRRRVEGKPDMQRRTFIEAIGLGLVTGPVIAQPTGRVRRIGFLSPVASQPAPLPPVEALREGLRAEGFVEGRNLAVEWRFAEWKLERLPELAADLVRLKV